MILTYYQELSTKFNKKIDQLLRLKFKSNPMNKSLWRSNSLPTNLFPFEQRCKLFKKIGNKKKDYQKYKDNK